MSDRRLPRFLRTALPGGQDGAPRPTAFRAHVHRQDWAADRATANPAAANGTPARDIGGPRDELGRETLR